MNLNIFRSIFICSCIFIQFSCKKENIKSIDTATNTIILSSKMENVPKIKSIQEIDFNNSLVKHFLQKNKDLINTEEIQNAYFSKILFIGKEELVGLQIHYLNIKYYEKDIFFVINIKTNNSVELLREKFPYKGNENNSILQFKEINGNIIINDKIENGKAISELKNKDYLIKSNMVPIWHCTATMFNMIYQEAKKKCEENAICDFACSFSNCSISYLAYAIDKCTVNA